MVQNLSQTDSYSASRALDSSDIRKQEAEGSQESTTVRTEPGQKTTNPDGSQRDSLELSREAQEIRELQRRDQEVRAHEAAHAAVGGQFAGSPSYALTKGADGRSYATDGEVSISVSAVPGDPEATVQKATQVRAAALAPANPSSQDMKVAQKAQMMAAKARQELSRESSVGQESSKDKNALSADSQQVPNSEDSAYQAYAGSVSEFISLSIYT